MAQSNFQRLISYLRPHWKISGIGIFALLLVNGSGVLIPLLIRDGIDTLQVTFSFARISQYAGLVAVC
jgi:ATP-binding cassette subfamily B multidrug efflux pump